MTLLFILTFLLRTGTPGEKPACRSVVSDLTQDREGREAGKAYEEQARAWYERGDVLRAVSLYREWAVCESNPELRALALHNEGAALNALGRYREAELVLRQALEERRAFYGDDSHPQVALTLQNLGYNYLKREEWAKAREYYSEAVKAWPHGEALYQLGTLEHRAGALDNAKRLYQRALAMEGGSNALLRTAAQHHLGLLAVRGHRFAEAAWWLEQAQRSAPNERLRRSVTADYAAALRKLGRKTEARREAERTRKPTDEGAGWLDYTVDVTTLR